MIFLWCPKILFISSYLCMVHLLFGIWWPVDTMAMATANTLTTNWIFFWLKTAFSADLLCLMFVLCLMKKTMVVSWWVGGEKSERLSKCWLKLWRWRCTWNDQTNTSYALGHLGNLDILWELENVVVICNMNYIFCWDPGWQKTLPNQQKPSFPQSVCSMHVHPVWNSATGLNLFCFH